MKYARNNNGTVKRYNKLPNTWKNYVNFPKADAQVIEDELFFPINEATPTKYQRKEALIVSDFNNSTKEWDERLYDMNQDEIDAVDQAELDADASAQKYSTRVSDGQVQYKRFVDKIIRDKDNSTITGQEALAVILNFNEGMQYLKDGFQEATKNVINGITPANQYETDLQTLIVDKLTNYISNNPL